jgi:CMP/dCMP kinase
MGNAAMIITIDGPAGTGKTTVARGVAHKLEVTYVDTGAMYRAITYFVMQREIPLTDPLAIEAALREFEFTERGGERAHHYYINGVEVTEQIRSPEVTRNVSLVSSYPGVRLHMVPLQRKRVAQIDAVCEGRDMGTVVFPDAEYKFFLTARPEVRAERRYRELLLTRPDSNPSFDQVLRDIMLRDAKDTSRAVSPLRPAADAIQVDTSEMAAEEVIARIVQHVRS